MKDATKLNLSARRLTGSNTLSKQCLARDILSPNSRRFKEKRAYHKYKKNYGDDGLSSSWIQYNQTVRHPYILFVVMVCSAFSVCSPGLVYLWPNTVFPSYLQPEYLRELHQDKHYYIVVDDLLQGEIIMLVDRSLETVAQADDRPTSP